MKESVSNPLLCRASLWGGTHAVRVLTLMVFGISTLAQAQVGGPWVAQGPGPSTMSGTQITGGVVTGAIEAVAADPASADILYIGSVNGGIWRTANATAAAPTWVPQTDDKSSLSISALEFDFGSSTTLVAGIGTRSSFASVGGAKLGLLRTTNSGTTWTAPAAAGLAALPNISGLASRGTTIVVAVDASTPLFTTTIGIYRSTDTGATFTRINATGGAGTGLPLGRAHDLASNPNDATQLFTNTQDVATNGIYRSNDTGATWTKVSTAPIDALLVTGTTSEVQIAVGKQSTDQSTANVYVAICGAAGKLTGLFRSGDAGGAWTAMDLPTTPDPVGDPPGLHPGGQCSIHLSLVADPTNHNLVYIGGDRQTELTEGAAGGGGGSFPNSIGGTGFFARLFRIDASLVLGSQALPLTNCSSAALAGCSAVSTTGNTAPHADSREMVFDAAGSIIQTDDGGVFRRTSPSGTGDWFSVNGNLAVIEQHSAAIGSFLSGNQDNGTTTLTNTALAPTWIEIFSGDGADVAIQKGDGACGGGTAPCATHYYSAQKLIGFSRRVIDSATPPAVLSTVTIPLASGGDPAICPQFVTPIEVNGGTGATNKARLILGGQNRLTSGTCDPVLPPPAGAVATGVYESMDRGDTIARISTAIINASGANAIAYGNAGNPDALYFGVGDLIHVRTAAPPTAPAASTDPDGASTDFIKDIVLDPDDATGMTAFAIDTNQVFMTTDGGATWTELTISGTPTLTSFAPGALRSLEYLTSGTGDGIAVGTDKGVYIARQASGFDNWFSFGTGLPAAPVFDLDYDAAADMLLAGTLGRGAWTLKPVMAVVPVQLQYFEVE